MVLVLKFFAGYSVLIYLVLAFGLLFAVRALVRARRELNESIFGLERELANRHITQAVTGLSIILLIGIGELILTVFLIPNLPALSILSTPTMNPLVTPTTTIPPELLATLGVNTPQPTGTAQSVGCIPGQIAITSPKPGDTIKGKIDLIGTANIPNFGFYKYEYSPLGVDTWDTIQAGDQVRQDEKLGSWDTSEITPGYYNLRLVVSDYQGNSLPACIIPVQIAAP
jgi:hypothetical protein